MCWHLLSIFERCQLQNRSSKPQKKNEHNTLRGQILTDKQGRVSKPDQRRSNHDHEKTPFVPIVQHIATWCNYDTARKWEKGHDSLPRDLGLGCLGRLRCLKTRSSLPDWRALLWHSPILWKKLPLNSMEFTTLWYIVNGCQVTTLLHLFVIWCHFLSHVPNIAGHWMLLWVGAISSRACFFHTCPLDHWASWPSQDFNELLGSILGWCQVVVAIYWYREHENRGRVAHLPYFPTNRTRIGPPVPWASTSHITQRGTLMMHD
jgi:hypothetical protein